MKFYIASKLENAELVRTAIAELRAAGHEVTYDWTTHGNVRRGPGSEGEIALVAEAEVHAVCNADAVVVLLPGGRGTHVELGIAIGAGKEVVLWSPDPARDFGTTEATSAFYHSLDVERHYGSFPQLVEYLLRRFGGC